MISYTSLGLQLRNEMERLMPEGTVSSPYHDDFSDDTEVIVSLNGREIPLRVADAALSAPGGPQREAAKLVDLARRSFS